MIDVVAAVLVKDDKILIAKRKLEKVQGGYWEFPGGKVEKGEIPSESLIRELKEEMEIVIDVKEHIIDSIYDYGTHKVKLIGFISTILEGSIVLNDHDEYRWVTLNEIDNFKLAPADVEIADAVKDRLSYIH